MRQAGLAVGLAMVGAVLSAQQPGASTPRSTRRTRFSASTRWWPSPPWGDFNYEHESTDQRTFGSVKFPIAWHSHQGWDDNFGFENVSAGHNAFGGTFPNVEPNNCGAAVTVPDAARRAATAPSPAVSVDRLAEGVYLLGGRSGQQHRRRIPELRRRVRSAHERGAQLAVIEAVARLMPNKPIRYLVNSHQHFDHIGGIPRLPPHRRRRRRRRP